MSKSQTGTLTADDINKAHMHGRTPQGAILCGGSTGNTGVCRRLTGNAWQKIVQKETRCETTTDRVIDKPASRHGERDDRDR